MAGPESPFSNNPERSKERIHERGEVLPLFSERMSGLPGIEELSRKIVRELYDEDGLYLLEEQVQVLGSEANEIEEYRYTSKGPDREKNPMDASRIDIVYYINDMPVGSNQLAKFNETTQAWDKV